MSASDTEMQGLMEQIEALQKVVLGLQAEVAELRALSDDLDDLAAEIEDAGARGGEPPMTVRHRVDDSGGYPFGYAYPFGIAIDGAVVRVYEQIVYRGGVPLVLASGNVTIEADGDWVALKVTPSAIAGADTLALVRWPAADGVPADKDWVVYRGLHEFAFADGVATWRKAGWTGGDLGMMGY